MPDEINLKPKKNLLTYGAIAAGGLVILLVLMKKGGAAAADTSGGGANTSQPIIIPAGGGSSGPDATTTAALQQLGQNQQDLASGITAGFAGLSADNADNTASNTSLAEGIAAGFSGVSNMLASRTAPPQAIPGPVTTSPPPPPASAVHTFFGATVDVQSARDRFGLGSNMKYVDTSNMSYAQTRSALQKAGGMGLIVGGDKAGGGVDATEAAGLGVTRVFGQDRQGTLEALRNVNF